ncbi:MAG: DUF721 domain-containing protein [Pseudomonadota bacterium]
MGKSGDDETRDQHRREKGRPFHRPSRAVRSRLKGIAASKGFAEPDVLLRWPEAVGPALSEICRPVKVSYGGAMGATLIVFADGARATEVEHRAPQIVDRINSFYGYRAISRLKITQATGRRGVARGFAEDARGFAGAPIADHPKSPTGAAIAKAAGLTQQIRDPGLRDALTKMGAWVLSRPVIKKSDEETTT